MHRFLLSTSFLVILTTPAAHAGERPLNPRIDTGLKLGTERGIVTTEIWVPVRQASDRVLYADARLTGDDGDNFEGNLGGGYRHIYGDTVLGAHGWIDRRKTARGSTFNQATVGVEALGRDFDARLNAYVPLSGSKTYATPNTGRDAPYLAGSGVFYDTTGQLVEEPQGGFDIELGARLPVFEQSVDSIRVYGGGYHFDGDETPDVTGWRARVSADVTSWMQVGARFQKDSERGSQGFLEATLRFPGKASFRREGLRARLDESPERDIDIVTGSAITDSGIGKPVLNETGNPQRVLHVDNTASGDGKGTKDRPYATLKAAEAAMKPYDVIYVREGDGGTTGQDLGIVIDKPGVKLIGSGVDLVYEGNRVTGAAAGTSTGTVLAAATAAPVITNATPPPTPVGTDPYAGNAVLIRSPNATVAGINVSYATFNGIYALLNDGVDYGELQIHNVTAYDNDYEGIRVDVTKYGSYLHDLNVTDVLLQNNRRGIWIFSYTDAVIARSNISNAVATGNSNSGVQMRSDLGADILDATFRNIQSYTNATNGMMLESFGLNSTITSNVSSASLTGNLFGFITTTSSSAAIRLSINHTTATDNARDGVYLNDDTSGTFLVDLGGGLLGSVGGNRIYGNGTSGNPYRDVLLDLDNSPTALAAQGNWWGQAGGPLAGRIRNEGACPSCGTADTSNALAADPGL